MKRVIFLLGIMLLMAGAAKAQDAKTQSGPEIEFEEIVHDYGDVPYNGNEAKIGRASCRERV